MPRIEIEFQFDIVVCFGISLAPYAVFFFFFFHSDLPSKHSLFSHLSVLGPKQIKSNDQEPIQSNSTNVVSW